MSVVRFAKSVHRPTLRSGALVVGIAASALVLAACGSSPTTSTTTTTTPPATSTSTGNAATTTTTTATASAALSLVKASKAAMLEQTAVRYTVAVTNTKQKSSYSIVADLGSTTGMQTLSTTGATAQVRVTTTDAYLSGNATGLADFFGMPTKDIAKVGTNWVAVPSTSSQYTSLADSNTLGPIATTLYPTTKAVSLTKGTFDGAACHVLSWKQSNSGTTSELHLYVSATGPALPLYALGLSGGTTQKISFSKWNENVNVVAPTPTIPFSSVSGS